jgi:hypothetical protein
MSDKHSANLIWKHLLSSSLLLWNRYHSAKDLWHSDILLD